MPRRSLEAIAVEAYRTGALSESQVRRLLRLESRFQVHRLLKEHNVPLQYSAADLEDDLKRNESSEFSPVDDRRGRQRAVALSNPVRTHRPPPAFYGQVLVPQPVAREPSATAAPAILREWIRKPPTRSKSVWCRLTPSR